MEKITLPFEMISERIRTIEFPQADAVVGIGNGGAVPASLVAFHLGLPLQILTLSYRDEQNRPQHPEPQIVSPPLSDYSGKRVLLVDDVSVSGKTLAAARLLLGSAHVTTLVLKGSADLVAFPEVSTCVNWPWK